MLILDADLTGLDDALHALDRMQDATQEQRVVLKDYSAEAMDIYRDHTPVGRGEKPGQLKQGYAVTEQSAGPTAAQTRIENRTPYLRWVLEGRGRVVAIRAKALRFVIDGQVIFRKAVGPAEANPFNEPAEREIENAAGQYADQLAALVAERFA